MIYSTLAVLTLSASAALPNLGTMLHLHPHTAPKDDRINVTLNNRSAGFRDLKIDGHVYTVLGHHALTVKAPAGTPVYADSLMALHRRGDLLLTVTPEMNRQTVNLQ